MKRLAIFDFCDTLISWQTFDLFIDFCLAQSSWGKSRNILHEKIYTTRYIGFVYNRLYPRKNYELSFLKGFSFNESLILDFVKEILVPREHKTIVNLLYEKYNQGYDVVINSWGYSRYIQYRLKTKDIQWIVVATELETLEGKFTGKMLGKDCMRKHKVTKMKKMLDLSAYDLKNSFVYSDSLSDRPLFNLVGNKMFVLSNSNKDIQNMIPKKFTLITIN